jgi:hypothetical protein
MSEVKNAAEPLLPERIQEICLANKMGEQDLWVYFVGIVRREIARHTSQDAGFKAAFKRAALDLEVKETEAEMLHDYLRDRFSER